VSGHVARRGLRGAAGIGFAELLETHCGGMLNGRRLKAVIRRQQHAGAHGRRGHGVQLDFDGLAAAGSMLGSAA